MKLKDFKKGMKVKYVPYHAYSDINHKDCEDVVQAEPMGSMQALLE